MGNEHNSSLPSVVVLADKEDSQGLPNMDTGDYQAYHVQEWSVDWSAADTPDFCRSQPKPPCQPSGPGDDDDTPPPIYDDDWRATLKLDTYQQACLHLRGEEAQLISRQAVYELLRAYAQQ